MIRGNVLIACVVAIAATAFGVWWMHTFERVEQTIDLPLKGAARFNPLLALERTLRARGHDVATRSHLNLPTLELGPGDTLVTLADSRNLTHDDVERLMRWIGDGGHLVMAIPVVVEGETGALLETLGVTPEVSWSCLRFAAPPKEGQACFGKRFDVDTEAVGELDWSWGPDEDGLVFARQSRGEGSWLVAADLDFLTNRELDEPGNAALAWQVLGPALGDGTVHLVYLADVPKWYVLLVQNGWPVLVPALLALLAWLWSRSQRLGPLLPLAPPHRRALLEHVQASGDFVFHRGRAIAQHAALRRAFDATLRRREPALLAHDGDALVQALAARSGRPVADVRQALAPVDVGRPERFLASIRTLMELRRKP